MDEAAWIDEFFDKKVKLGDEILNKVKMFTLFWNLYETFACNKNANTNAINVAVENLNAVVPINNQLIEPHLIYFSNRYFNPDKTPTLRFAQLLLQGQGISDHVKDVLLRHNTDPVAILKGLMYIVYRYRNNLFHGNKNVVYLDGQVDNFAHANKLLSDVLLLMKKNNLIQ